MFNFFYNVGLFLVLFFLALPKIMQRKYRNTLAARLGLKLPQCPQTAASVIWIHAISMGETRAVIPLFQKLKKEYPEAQILVSTTTETGLAEAKKNMPEAAAHFLLPFDFSWIIKRVVNKYQPNLLILVESDFWHNLLHQVKKRKGHVVLINGKISERSFKRFQRLSFFSKRLFSQIDHFCLQNEKYKDCFVQLGVEQIRCTITGNIKLDFTPKFLSVDELNRDREEFGIQLKDPVIVIGSTHPVEEETLLQSFEPLFEKISNLKVILVPRHPERFKAVGELLKKKGYHFITYTERALKSGNESIILVDAMGLLNRCYQLASVAIVGGSFVERIGGHNILEPTLVGVPVLFGPYMSSQTDLVDLVLSAHAGFQVTSTELPDVLFKLLDEPSEHQAVVDAAYQLTTTIRGATEKTFQVLQNYLNSSCS